MDQLARAYPAPNRSFEPINTIENPTQTTEKRFGKKFQADEYSRMRGNNYDNGCFKDALHSLVPFEKYRKDLVALSQNHNIYFVALRNQIYVYRPRNLNQALPGKPDLVIRPPSLTGVPKTHSIYPDHPHCINNMLTAYLGNQEILLMGFDDGDVYAYYTCHVQACLQKRERDPNLPQLTDIKPLFKQNFADSVWGLAVHQNKGLIAVSTNHAIHRLAVVSLDKPLFEGSSLISPTGLEGFAVYFHLNCHNIPSLDWTNYDLNPKDHGMDLLVAQDINGKVIALTMADILEYPNSRHLHQALITQYPLEYDFRPLPVRSWAMAVLGPDFFMPANTVEEIFGNAYISSIKTAVNSTYITVDKEKSPSFKSTSYIYPEIIQQTSEQHNIFGHGTSFPAGVFCTTGSGLDITLLPMDYKNMPLDLVCDIPPRILPSFSEDIFCLHNDMPRYREILQDPTLNTSSSQLVKIPELSLLILGSVTGRVVLITATYSTETLKFDDALTLRPGQISYRIESILPSMSQQLISARPVFPLVGIAVSPLQEKTENSGVVEEKRFRLLLHYYDHSILSYELSRRTIGLHDFGVCVTDVEDSVTEGEDEVEEEEENEENDEDDDEDWE